MKTLIGLTLGLVAGVVVVAALNVSMGIDKFWPAIVVGLLIGFIARKVDSANAASYLRGALAAVATIAAITVGQLSAAQVTQQLGPKVSLKGAAAAAEAATGDEDSANAAGANAAPTAVETVRVDGVGPIDSLSGRSPGDAFAVADIAFLVIGCVLAYEVGKGSNAPTTGDEENAEADDGESAATDPGGEPAADAAPEHDH